MQDFLFSIFYSLFVMFLTAYAIFAVENMNEFYLDLQNGSGSKINLPIESKYATSYVLAIAMFTISVIACEIFTFELFTSSLVTNLSPFQSRSRS